MREHCIASEVLSEVIVNVKMETVLASAIWEFHRLLPGLHGP
jgi:hypothetical protein